MKQILHFRIWAIFLSPLLCLLIIWNSVPDRVPVHFNFSGEADRFGERIDFLWIVITLVIVNVCAFYLITNAYRIVPQKNQEENKVNICKLGFVISVFLTAIIFFIIYSTINGAKGSNVKTSFIFSMLGLLYCALGNYMYSIKPNGLAGIRIPTTLNDSENWKKTHQFASKLWFWGGLLTAVICLFLSSQGGFITFIVSTIVLVIIPIIYSMQMKKRK